MSDQLIVRAPASDQEWIEYYQIRYNVLRKPWNQPKGSEKDPSDETSIHAAAFKGSEVVGVGRLNRVDANSGQIRFMATHPDYRGKGVGRQIIFYLEGKAIEIGLKELMLESRENAVDFYKKLGYSILKPSFLLFNSIQHFTMVKQLKISY